MSTFPSTFPPHFHGCPHFSMSVGVHISPHFHATFPGFDLRIRKSGQILIHVGGLQACFGPQADGAISVLDYLPDTQPLSTQTRTGQKKSSLVADSPLL